MKRFVLLSVLFFAAPFLRAQDVLFWTNDTKTLPIRVYVDKEYVGEVSTAYSSKPEPGAEGCLYMVMSPEVHSVTAVNCYGELYDGWSGKIRPEEGALSYVKIKKGSFKTASQASRNDEELFWLWYGWDPIIRPYPVRYHHHDLDIDPDDDALLVTMAVATVGGLAAMTAAAVKNWDYPDDRFPYFSAGYKFEYMCGLEAIRNVARFKYRFGNLGGISLIGDAGYRISEFGRRNIREFDSRYDYNSFTWSLGFGLEYGGFNFGVRYKPAFNVMEDSFLVADIDYDWILGEHFILSFNSGFGVCGYGDHNLLDRFEFPIGVSFSYKF